MSSIIQFPVGPDRLWRDYERMVRRVLFPGLGVRASEELELIERLKVHWSWIHGPASFSSTVTMPASCTEAEMEAVRQAIQSVGDNLMAGWGETIRAAIVQFAKVELALMRSLAGEPPPFDEMLPKPKDFDESFGPDDR